MLIEDRFCVYRIGKEGVGLLPLIPHHVLTLSSLLQATPYRLGSHGLHAWSPRFGSHIIYYYHASAAEISSEISLFCNPLNSFSLHEIITLRKNVIRSLIRYESSSSSKYVIII